MDILKGIRTDPSIIANGLYLYFNSRSYILVSKSYLWNLLKRGHMSLFGNWSVQKYSRITEKFVV